MTDPGYEAGDKIMVTFKQRGARETPSNLVQVKAVVVSVAPKTAMITTVDGWTTRVSHNMARILADYEMN